MEERVKTMQAFITDMNGAIMAVMKWAMYSANNDWLKSQACHSQDLDKFTYFLYKIINYVT